MFNFLTDALLSTVALFYILEATKTVTEFVLVALEKR